MDAGSLSSRERKRDGVESLVVVTVVVGGGLTSGVDSSRSIWVLLTRKAAHSSMVGGDLGAA